MKTYKRYQVLFTVNFISIIIFIVFIVYSYFNYYNEYTKINARYIVDNYVEVILTTKELKKLEVNKYLYLNSKKEFYKITSITKNIYKRGNLYYNEVLLHINKVRSNTILNISVFNKKRTLISLFIDCFKED